MECISELKDSLNVYFGWNKARMACFVNMLLALLATRTVNLNKLACVVFGDALQSSRYRRIQRFFSKFPLDYQQIAGFIFKLFFVSDGQWYLSMDRTHWRWGKSDINILMLGIVFKGTAIPIYWMLLVPFLFSFDRLAVVPAKAGDPFLICDRAMLGMDPRLRGDDPKKYILYTATCQN